MNYAQAVSIHPQRQDNSPILPLRPVRFKPWTLLNRPRETGEYREQQILEAVRSYDGAVRYADIARKVRLGKSALLDHVRIMVRMGRLKRRKTDTKNYIYWIPK